MREMRKALKELSLSVQRPTPLVSNMHQWTVVRVIIAQGAPETRRISANRLNIAPLQRANGIDLALHRLQKSKVVNKRAKPTSATHVCKLAAIISQTQNCAMQ